MSNKLQQNNAALELILNKINSLPEAGSGGETLEPILQDKTVTPTTSTQTVKADLGYDGLDTVTVNAMPTATQATPSVTIDSSGLITATATQTAGYVTAGTKSGTKQLTTQAAKTVTPTKSTQTAVAKNVYTTGVVTVGAIPDEYIVPSGSLSIKTNGSHNVTSYAEVNVEIETGIDTSDATAAANEILSGKTAYVDGTKLTGTMPNNGDVSSTMDGISTNAITIPAGYTTGGVVSLDDTIDNEADAQSDLIDQIIATANSLPEVGSGGPTDDRDLYQRVEYIESAENGTYPYIITDFIADNSCGLEVIASFSVMQDRIPMGSRTDGNATRFYCVYPLSTSSVYYGFNGGSSISCSTSLNTIYRLQTNFLNSRLVNVYEEDGTRKASASLNATLVDQNVPVSIFGYHSGSSGSISSKREYKLYSARCSKGHEVVREYIPCYRKSDGVVGVYEKCTGQFLTDASGSASGFAKGPDIDW